MRRKIRYDRLILLALVVIMFIVVVFLGVKKLFFSNPNPSESDEPQVTISSDPSKDIDVSLGSYTVYASEELDFRFVIGEFTFKANDGKAIDFDLSKLETNELIQLNNTESYTSKLQAQGYSMSKLGTTSSVKSNESALTVKLLIPVTKKSDSLTITNLNNSKQISIDLTVNAGDINDFKSSTGGTITDGKTYDIYVSNAYVSTSMYREGVEYSYPSTVKVYTFKLEVNELAQEGVSIEKAYFIPSGSDTEYQALGSSFSSMKEDNIIGVPLKANDSYALFFEMFNPDESGITYKGTLQLVFSNSNQVVEISTSME